MTFSIFFKLSLVSRELGNWHHWGPNTFHMKYQGAGAMSVSTWFPSAWDLSTVFPEVSMLSNELG